MIRSWTRKTALQNIDPTKHVTIGSTVTCIGASKKEHEVPIPIGTIGRVMESGKASVRARKMVGTTAAMRVEWDGV
jgi:hypothetical protein